jgi:hypothetical protein
MGHIHARSLLGKVWARLALMGCLRHEGRVLRGPASLREVRRGRDRRRASGCEVERVCRRKKRGVVLLFESRRAAGALRVHLLAMMLRGREVAGPEEVVLDEPLVLVVGHHAVVDRASAPERRASRHLVPCERRAGRGGRARRRRIAWLVADVAARD